MAVCGGTMCIFLWVDDEPFGHSNIWKGTFWKGMTINDETCIYNYIFAIACIIRDEAVFSCFAQHNGNISSFFVCK